MKYLLDTQAIIFFNLDDARLSGLARASITESGNSLLVSPASYWEMAIKISQGKLKIAVPYEEFWYLGNNASGFEIHPIEIRHTSHLIQMPFHHKDPFDRLLVAQSLVDDIPIISNDVVLDAYGVQRVW